MTNKKYGVIVEFRRRRHRRTAVDKSTCTKIIRVYSKKVDRCVLELHPPGTGAIYQCGRTSFCSTGGRIRAAMQC